jgi:NADP-dependent aldehyde dehydrogenase
MNELDYPRGLFAMLQGSTNALGAALVKHPATTAVGFTGSLRGGRALFDLAAARPTPIPVFAEMGSLNPIVILPAALAERSEAIAIGMAGSILFSGGQLCTKPGLIFLVGDENPTFVDALRKGLAATSCVTMLNMPLRNSFNERTSEFAKLPGVKSLIAPQSAAHAGVTPALFETTAETWLREPRLREEAFGPATVVVNCRDAQEAAAGVRIIEGSLTGTIHIGANEKSDAVETIVRALSQIAGRVIVNGFPTGVEVNDAIVHGGPYPATTDSSTTSVGTAAIRRFTRLIAFQNAPQTILPPELKDENPLKIVRRVSGKLTDASIG